MLVSSKFKMLDGSEIETPKVDIGVQDFEDYYDRFTKNVMKNKLFTFVGKTKVISVNTANISFILTEKSV